MSSESLIARLEKLVEPTFDLPPSILISGGYDGERKAAFLKFYDPSAHSIRIWFDDTGHRPYCYSKRSLEELKELGQRPDVVELKLEKKLDLLTDQEIELVKIVTTDPLAIGGSPSQKSIRNVTEAWEADIKYYENYIYDRGLIPGTFYELRSSKLIPISYELKPEVQEGLKKILESAHPEFKDRIVEWARILSQPLPDVRRASLDIEVFTPEENRLPSPQEARYPVVSAAMVSSDGVHEVFVLKRDVELGENLLESHVKVSFFDSEKEMVERVFHRILDYPFLVTFNGDDFDLNYLYHRALKLGFTKDEVPISLGKDVAYVKHGVHIDLYKVFTNRSLQTYAFGGKYVEHTLAAISEALLGESKLEYEGSISSLSLYELARYCYKDALLTYKLTSFDNDILVKLLLVITRIAKMPIDDVARLGVSNWIRSMLYYEHRKINALIPRKEELEEKGEASTTAIIKGKKYKGGLVVEPKAGYHFNVAVLDFASLYPSIIKVHNLSYETVRCVHEECRSNTIPGTNHWVCTKRRGISSLVIGSLRDLRVKYYKSLSKSKELSMDERNLYHVVSQALKVILNASYGVMGAEIFPLYCLPVAEATAALGRHMIGSTIKKCNELGIEVVYGDTDSVFLRSPTEEQLEVIERWAEEELGVELDLDKVYRYVAFSKRKKNYLGVMPDGSVDIKGLTGKKSHVPLFIKKAFYDSVEILSRVNSPEDFEKAREEIKKEIRERYVSLKEKRVPLEELAFNVMIGKAPSQYVDTTPQHVRAAQLLIDRGKEVKAGEIISYVKTVTPPGVKPVSMATVDEIDTTKYLEHMRSTLEQLLDALGYEFDEILGATKLEDFFWS